MKFWTRLLQQPLYFDEFSDLGGGEPDPFARLGDSFPGGDDRPNDTPEERPGEERQPSAANPGGGDPGREHDPANAGRTRLSDEEIERIVARNRELDTELSALRGNSTAEQERLRKILAAVAGVAPAEGGEDPRTKAVRDRMFTHFPELKVLAEYGTDLPTLMKELKELLPNLPKLREAFPTITRNLEDGQIRNAETFSDKLQGGYAAALLGDGKSGKDLTEKQVAKLGRNFIAFCSEDPQRVARYQRGDVRLVDEFLEEERETIQISRRQQFAGALNRNTVNVPSGGGSGTPLGGSDKAPSKDPDAIFEESWDKTQAVIGGGR